MREKESAREGNREISRERRERGERERGSAGQINREKI